MSMLETAVSVEYGLNYVDAFTRFVEGVDNEFSAYFFLGTHDSARLNFVRAIGISPELPEVDGQTMLQVGDVVLRAECGRYDEELPDYCKQVVAPGTPYDVRYIGERLLKTEVSTSPVEKA